MGAAAALPDVDLFAEQVGWIAPHLPQPNRLGILAWIGRRLHRNAQARFLSHFPIDHPVQRRAERHVIALLRRSWTQPALRYRRLDIPERHVDWPRTYLEATTDPPMHYWLREQTTIPDLGVISALAMLASSFIDLLGLGDATEDRRLRSESLQAAMAGLPHGAVRPAAYSLQHEQRLLRTDGGAREAALAIRECLSFWESSFGGEDDRSALGALARTLQAGDIDNRDTLLELSATLSIARAAVEAAPADCSLGEPWRIENLEDRDAKRSPIILLRAGRLRCRISKGVPQLDERRAEDALVAVLAEMGLHSTGNQPDIVLSFWREDGKKEVLTVLGDAKRNEAGSGERYLRAAVETAAAYLMSYGHLMRLRIHPDRKPGFHGPILPAVTLFCRQGVRCVVGNDSRDEEKLVAALRDRSRALPAILAFDLVHFGCREGEVWRSPALSAWFGRLARQAWETLDGGG
jgi:hypothetical protein